jgi:hypothetical protein
MSTRPECSEDYVLVALSLLATEPQNKDEEEYNANRKGDAREFDTSLGL